MRFGASNVKDMRKERRLTKGFNTGGLDVLGIGETHSLGKWVYEVRNKKKYRV